MKCVLIALSLAGSKLRGDDGVHIAYIRNWAVSSEVSGLCCASVLRIYSKSTELLVTSKKWGN